MVYTDLAIELIRDGLKYAFSPPKICFSYKSIEKTLDTCIKFDSLDSDVGQNIF
jgi:hypothetical protein